MKGIIITKSCPYCTKEFHCKYYNYYIKKDKQINEQIIRDIEFRLNNNLLYHWKEGCNKLDK